MATRQKSTSLRSGLKSGKNSLPGPDDIHRVVLSNGVIVLTRPNFDSPSVSVTGYFYAGSLADPDEKLGLSDFTAAALMRGTHERSFDAIYNGLESVGASLGFDSLMHTTSFGGRCLVEDLGLVLDLIAEILKDPAFPDTEVEKLRAQLLTGLAIRAQDTGDMASLTFDKIIFEGHPYSRPGDGYPQTIQAISRDDLVEFHRRYYGTNGLVIAVVGAVEPAKVVAEVERTLGAWKSVNQVEQPGLPAHKPLTRIVQEHHKIAGKSQSDLVIGVVGPKRKDPEYIAASLGNSILGQFGLMGRIGDVVREKSGLAYYAHSSLSPGVGPGAWEVSAGVNPKNIKKATELILKELDRFVKRGVTSEELADNQANYIGRLPLSLESNSGVAGALINIERYDLGLDYYRKYADLVRAVTRDEILMAARKYIYPGKLAIAVAGP